MSGNSIDLGSIYASVRLDLTPVQAAMDALKEQLAQVQGMLADFVGAVRDVGVSAAQATEPVGALDDALDTGSVALQALAVAAGEADGALASVAGTLADAGVSVDAASAEVDANTAALDANTEAADANAAGHKAAGEASAGLGDSMGKLVAPLAIAEAAIVGTGAVAIKMASDFQAGITSLATGAGESQANLKLVSDGILSLSESTGESTSQLTAAMYQIESSGLHGKAALDALGAAARGAMVGSSDLGVVGDATTTILNDYSKSGVTAANAVNLLVATTASGKVHMQDLGQALAQILPTASAAGVGLTDVMGAMATMTSLGVPAANAATYLRQTITALEAPSKQTVKALAAVGLKSSDVAAEMQKSLPDALKMITDAVGKKFPEGSAGYIAALKGISGGSKQMQGVLDLTGDHMATFQHNVANIGGVVKQAGNSIQGWAEVQKDFNTQLAQAGATAKVALIQVGTALEPIAKQVIANLMPALKQFGDWARTHGPEIAKAFAIAAGVIGVALAGALAGATVAFLLAQAAAIGIVAALALVGAGVVAVVMHWQQIKDFFTSSTPAALAVKAALVALGGALAGAAVYGITVFVASIPALIAGFTTWAAAAWAAAAPTLLAAAPFIAIGAAIALVAVGIYELVTHWSQVKTFLGNIASAVGAFFQTVASFVTTWGEKLLNLYLWPYREAWTLLQAAWHAIVGLVQQGAADVVGSFSWLYNHNYYFKDLVDFITSTIQNGLKFVEQLWTNDVAFVLAVWNDLKKGAQIAWQGIHDFIIQPIQVAWAWLTTTVGGWANWLGGQWSKIVAGVTTWWNNLTGAVKSGGGAALDQMKAAFITPITSAISGVITQALTWGENLMKMLAQGIANGAGGIKQAATNALGGLGRVLGFHSPAAEGPGADADTWAPNLMQMFAAGLAASGPLLAQAAASALLGVRAALTNGVSGVTGATFSGGSSMGALARLAPVNVASGGVLREAITSISSGALLAAGSGALAPSSAPLAQASQMGSSGYGDVHIYGLTVEVVAAPSDGEPYQAGMAFGNGFAAGFQQARTQRGL